MNTNMRNTIKTNQTLKSVLAAEDKPNTELIKSTALFHGQQQVVIEHEGEIYLLRITKARQTYSH